MPEEAVATPPPVAEPTTTLASPFAEGAWKSEPTPAPVVNTDDPAIKEKDENIKEEKPVSDKSDDPLKIPGATPPPIQDKPTEEPKTKEPEPKAEALKFANPESERLFNLLKEGKVNEVYPILHEQQVLAGVDKMEPADIIKLNLQYRNKDFSPQEINDLFNEQYMYPEKPERDTLDSETEFEEKMKKYEKEVTKVNNRIARDAKPAKSDLLKLQREIVLPDIPKETPKPKEPTQEELEAANKAKEGFLNEVAEKSKAFSGYNTTFKDEEVEIPVAYPVTDEERLSVKPLLESAYSDLPTFFNQLGWTDKDGNINTAKLIEDCHLLQNREKVFAKIASETGNKRHEASIKSIKNIDYSGGQRSNGDLGATPAEKQKALATHFFSQ